MASPEGITFSLIQWLINKWSNCFNVFAKSPSFIFMLKRKILSSLRKSKLGNSLSPESSRKLQKAPEMLYYLVPTILKNNQESNFIFAYIHHPV